MCSALENSSEETLKSDQADQLITLTRNKGDSLATEIGEDDAELLLWVENLQPKPQQNVQLARGLPFYALAGYILLTLYSS